VRPRPTASALVAPAQFLLELIPHLVEFAHGIREGADVSYDETRFTGEPFPGLQVTAKREIVRGFVLMLLAAQDSVHLGLDQGDAGRARFLRSACRGTSGRRSYPGLRGGLGSPLCAR